MENLERDLNANDTNNLAKQREAYHLEAIKRLEIMESKGLEKQYVDSFKKGDIPLFENMGRGFNAVYFSLKENVTQYPYSYLWNEIQSFESKTNSVVYLIQLTHYEFGDCYSFFYVGDDMESWYYDVKDLQNEFIPDIYVQNVYCWNADVEDFSEYGQIGFKYSMGGITRTS